MKPHQISQLALGTVQFGLDYGVANAAGQVSEQEAARILSYAESKGVKTLDTAIAYGQSETVLGKLDTSTFELVTKLPSLPTDHQPLAPWVEAQIEGSLQRLNRSSLDALLLHNASDLHGARASELYDLLLSAKASRKVKKIGWSVYSPSDLESIPAQVKADLVQLPFNIFDQSMLTSGWLERLANSGTQIHARSVFLQGLLLIAPEKRPAYFHQWDDIWQEWDAYLTDNNLSAMEACLAFSLGIKQIDQVLIGVDSHAQLKQILELEMREDIPAFKTSTQLPQALINPSLWKLA